MSIAQGPKIWRAGKDFLVERGDSYLLVDGTGAITKRFEPSSWVIEDEDGKVTYGVEKDALREYVHIHRPGNLDHWEQRVVEGLALDDDPDVVRFITTAVGDDLVVREEQRLREERAAEARLAAIEGARADYRMGPLFARAQEALEARVYSYGDTTAGALLRMLIDLARANAHPPAVHAFARGCLHASFAHVPIADDDAESVPAPELAAKLAPLVALLDSNADGQEWVDANNNALEYRRAARAVREAIRLLGG